MKINQTEFKRNLLLNQQYCDLQLDNSLENSDFILRSLNSKLEANDLFSYKFIEEGELKWIETVWNTNILEKFRYNEVFNAQLKYKYDFIFEKVKTKFKGKILIAEIDLTVLDGASEVVSGGLFDLNDCPPIDTWFYLTKSKMGRVLFAWIPEPFEDLANKGVEVNAMECLKWFKEESTQLTKFFKWISFKY